MMGAACVDVSVWTLNSTSLPNVRIVRGVRRGAKRRGAARPVVVLPNEAKHACYDSARKYPGTAARGQGPGKHYLGLHHARRNDRSAYLVAKQKWRATVQAKLVDRRRSHQHNCDA
jgi:hypothetical protein